MDLSKLIDLIAEVAVRRAVQKEAKDKATPEAVWMTISGFVRFTRDWATIYAALSLTPNPRVWCCR